MNPKMVAGLVFLSGTILLAGCTTTSLRKAEVVDLSGTGLSSQATQAQTQTTYTVKAGDTLYSIARQYNVRPFSLAQINEISDPSALRIGTRIKIPNTPVEPTPASSGEAAVVDISSGVSVEALEPQENTQTTEKPVDVVPMPEREQAVSEVKTATSQAPTSITPSSASGIVGAKMLWPSRGPVLENFSDKNSSLKIGGAVGNVVVAADAGSVLYIGELRAYGRLVIIKHTPTLVTAYGNNNKIVVKVGDKVNAGQKIAEMGKFNDGTPGIRFEVRKSGKPQDPMHYLPKL